MARPRLPKAKAEVSGASLKDPQRFRDRTGIKDPSPIGEPYPQMSEAEQACWHELAGELPWLNSSHRMLLRLTCRLAARLETGEEVGVSASQTLSSLLSKLGATPVDESRVTFPSSDDDDDEWFRPRPN